MAEASLELHPNINKSDGTMIPKKNGRTCTLWIKILQKVQGLYPKKTCMDKQTFRTHALKQLRSLSSAQARHCDRKVRQRLLERISDEKAKRVMLYIPLPGEVDVLPLIGALRRRGITVLVPFMEGESFRLVQYRLPLRTKQYGVREPNISKKYRNKRIDIAIVPIVGTDRTLRRVGFGRGMYDRFFAREHGRIGRTIFVQRALQWSPDVVTDAWDVRADEIIVGTRR